MTLAEMADSFSIADDDVNEFSPEAIEDFYVFLKEAQLLDQGIRLLNPDLFYWLSPVYHIKRTEILGVKSRSGAWLQKPRFPKGIVFRKASQMGASTWSVAFIVWLAIDRSNPLAIGCYWPTKEELQVFIATRLDPMLEASERLKSYLADADFNNTQAKNIGNSTIYFRHVAGKSAMDSVPLDVVIADEVRLWPDPDRNLQRIEERMGQSDVQLRVLMSTTGTPEDYMEQRWFESNQMKYFTQCPSGCATLVTEDSRADNILLLAHEIAAAKAEGKGLIADGVCLSDYLPTQIIERTGKGEASYKCPCCAALIDDQSRGEYVACYPDSDGMYAIEFARTLSQRAAPSKVLSEYLSAKDMKQYMNGWMAKPYLNPEGRPVKPEDWQRAREIGASLGLTWRSFGAGCFLGADFRHNQTHIVIGEMEPIKDEETGLVYPGRLAHLEVYEGNDWPQRLDQLMSDYGVQQAIIDYLPDTNRTVPFAKKYEGRVLTAQYRSGDMIRLPDKHKAGRSLSPDGREEHMVLLDQVKSLASSLGSFASRSWLVPAGTLRQPFTDSKNYTIEDFDVVEGMDGKGREGFMQHIQGLALRNIYKETKTEHGEKVGVSGVVTQEFYDAGGFDPHFAHAFNYMVMASRVRPGGANLLRPSQQVKERVMAQQRGGAGEYNLAALGPQGYAGVQRLARVCGTCRHGPKDGEERAICQWIGYEVGANEPACNLKIGWKPR